MVLSERRHQLRVFNDEGRVEALTLEEFAYQLVDEPDGGPGVGAVHVMLLALLVIEDLSFFGFNILRERNSKMLFKFLHHGDSPPGGSEVDADHMLGMIVGIRMMLKDVAPGEFLDHLGEHIFGDIHQIIVVSVSHVELACSVFGIVSLVDRLVPEVLSDLEHSLQSAYDTLLEVQLGSDSHVQFHVQVIVMGHKGSGCGSTRNHVHHGSLNLDEVKILEVPSHKGDHLRPHDEGFTGAVVHDHVEVALTVSVLSVLEASMGFRKHMEARR